MNASFSVDGEFVCDLARTWLWDEKKDLDDCVAFLKDCLNGMSEEDKEAAAIGILEGRKKLEGTNSFQIADDGQNIRTLTTLVSKKEEEVKFLELKQDMEHSPQKYVDTGMGGKHMKIIDVLVDMRIRDVIEFRTRGFSDSTGWEEGCFLLTDPRLAYEILGGPQKNRENVVDKLTIYFRGMLQEWENAGIEYKDMTERQKRVYIRNMQCDKQFYAARRNEKIAAIDKPSVKQAPEKESLSFEELDREMRAELASKDINFKGRADDQNKIESEQGWIDPNGQYYSCLRAGHEMKAHAVLQEKADLRDAYQSFYAAKADPSDFRRNEQYWASEFLLENGWTKHFVPPFKNVCLGYRSAVNTKQIETSFKVKTKFKLDSVEKFYVYDTILFQ